MYIRRWHFICNENFGKCRTDLIIGLIIYFTSHSDNLNCGRLWNRSYYLTSNLLLHSTTIGADLIEEDIPVGLLTGRGRIDFERRDD